MARTTRSKTSPAHLITFDNEQKLFVCDQSFEALAAGDKQFDLRCSGCNFGIENTEVLVRFSDALVRVEWSSNQHFGDHNVLTSDPRMCKPADDLAPDLAPENSQTPAAVDDDDDDDDDWYDNEDDIEPVPARELLEPLMSGYVMFNHFLFGAALPDDCMITLQRKSKRTRGYFAPDAFRKTDGNYTVDGIALNPICFLERAAAEVFSTLVHEMAHLWQKHLGKPSRNEWANKMEEIGLMPSNTGAPDGKRTGQSMSHLHHPRRPVRGYLQHAPARVWPQHTVGRDVHRETEDDTLGLYLLGVRPDGARQTQYRDHGLRLYRLMDAHAGEREVIVFRITKCGLCLFCGALLPRGLKLSPDNFRVRGKLTRKIYTNPPTTRSPGRRGSGAPPDHRPPAPAAGNRDPRRTSRRNSRRHASSSSAPRGGVSQPVPSRSFARTSGATPGRSRSTVARMPFATIVSGLMSGQRRRTGTVPMLSPCEQRYLSYGSRADVLVQTRRVVSRGYAHRARQSPPGGYVTEMKGLAATGVGPRFC